jgi:hypothetical protein
VKRDIVFAAKGQLAVALGLSPERCREFDDVINDMIDRNASLQSVIEAMNERDLTDAEWTSFIFALGYYMGATGK